MFDIGFSEIVVCAVVALVVIGPERLPETVRTTGLWIGRIKRSLRQTREEIERQVGVDEIRRQLHQEEMLRTLEDARKEIDSALYYDRQDFSVVAEQQSLISPEKNFGADVIADVSHETSVDKFPEQYSSPSAQPNPQ